MSSWNYRNLNFTEFIDNLIQSHVGFNLYEMQGSKREYVRFSNKAPCNMNPLEYNTSLPEPYIRRQGEENIESAGMVEDINGTRNLITLKLVKLSNGSVVLNTNEGQFVWLADGCGYVFARIDRKWIDDKLNLSYVNIHDAGGTSVKLSYRGQDGSNNFVGKIQKENEFIILGKTTSENASIFNFVAADAGNNDVQLALMNRWLDNGRVRTILQHNYDFKITEACLNYMPNFTDCREVCPTTGGNTNAYCDSSFQKYCFDLNPNRNPKYELIKTFECNEWCTNNKEKCHRFMENKFCNKPDDLFDKDNFCYKFYFYSNQYNCNVNDPFCNTAKNKYINYCDSDAGNKDPRCKCISSVQINRNREQYFSNMEKEAIDVIISKIQQILDKGVPTGPNTFRPLTNDERQRLESYKLTTADAVKQLYVEYRKTHSNVSTVCFIDGCRIGENEKQVYECNIKNLVIATCLQNLNILALLGGRIEGTNANQTCNINIGKSCGPNDPKCEDKFECVNGQCVLKQQGTQDCRTNPALCKTGEVCLEGVCKPITTPCAWYEYQDTETNQCVINYWLIGGASTILLIIVMIIIILIGVYIYRRNK